MFSAPRQDPFNAKVGSHDSLPTYDIQHRSPWNQWSCFRSEYLQQQAVMDGSTRHVARGQSASNAVRSELYQLTCALVGRRTLMARTPSSLPWLQPCNFPLVVAVLQPIFARMTWGKAGRGRQLMDRPLAPPEFPIRKKYTLLADLLEVAAQIALPANGK
jgi:hypothetical protein